jgi:hypothetical protein
MIRRRNARGRIEKVRPEFNHAGPNERGNWTHDQSTAQLIESARNVLEQIRDSQTLQCDVALAIKRILKEMRGLRRDLKAMRKL